MHQGGCTARCNWRRHLVGSSRNVGENLDRIDHGNYQRDFRHKRYLQPARNWSVWQRACCKRPCSIFSAPTERALSKTSLSADAGRVRPFLHRDSTLWFRQRYGQGLPKEGNVRLQNEGPGSTSQRGVLIKRTKPTTEVVIVFYTHLLCSHKYALGDGRNIFFVRRPFASNCGKGEEGDSLRLVPEPSTSEKLFYDFRLASASSTSTCFSHFYQRSTTGDFQPHCDDDSTDSTRASYAPLCGSTGVHIKINSSQSEYVKYYNVTWLTDPGHVWISPLQDAELQR